jgi:hypothetical protein
VVEEGKKKRLCHVFVVCPCHWRTGGAAGSSSIREDDSLRGTRSRPVTILKKVVSAIKVPDYVDIACVVQISNLVQ